jgi:class 3 adenylate cyclase
MFDRRGTGLSDPVSRPPTLEQQMDDLGAVLDAVGVQQTALWGSRITGARARCSRSMPRARWGTHQSGDRYIPIEMGREVASLIPGARFMEYPGKDTYAWVAFPGIEDVEEFLTGRRGPTEIDRVLATVLFTDIVGSTDHASALGDGRWRRLLDEHNALVRHGLERWRGQEVKTIGDGFLATFDGPARAVQCAASIVDAVRALGIEIRAGLHTGECELVGRDVAGIAVHIGARVMANAGPGEVLASSTVKDLVVGSGLRFDDRGPHTLRGVPDEWHLYALER